MVTGAPSRPCSTERLAGFVVTTGMGIGFGCVVVTLYFYREQSAQARAETARVRAEIDAAHAREEKQMLSARLQLLQAQVEPHFLFNTLANVPHLMMLISLVENAAKHGLPCRRQVHARAHVRWRSADQKADQGTGRRARSVRFWQVHRATNVNTHAIAGVVRRQKDSADLKLKGRPETLTVSRAYLHLFRQM